MVFPVDVGLGHHEYVFEKELAKIFEVVSLPVGDAFRETLDDLLIVCSSVSLVDLCCDPQDGIGAHLELVKVSVGFIACCDFDQVLIEIQLHVL